MQRHRNEDLTEITLRVAVVGGRVECVVVSGLLAK